MISITIPLVLREKYPSAKITCAEVFPFFRAHLTKLGFEVIDWETVGDMKFDMVIGNPPYQSEKGTGTQPLWPLFVQNGASLLNDKGIMAMITPNKWCGHTTNVIKGNVHIYQDLLKGKLVSCNIQECSKHFPGIGGYENCFSWFIINNAGSDTFSATTLEGKVVVDNDLFEFLPLNNLSKLTAIILEKIKTKESFGFKQVSTGFTNRNNGAIVISMAQRLHYDRLNIYYDKDTIYSATSKSTVSTTTFDHSSQEKIDAVFRSELFKFIHKIFWNNDNFATKFYNSLPYLNLDIMWTDCEIYNKFGLTAEEIMYIGSSLN